MYLKIILKYLNSEQAGENKTLYFKNDLPQVQISQAEAIIKELDLKLDSKTEIRFQNIFEQNKMVGLLVSIVCP